MELGQPGDWGKLRGGASRFHHARMDPEKIQTLILQAMPQARVSVQSDDNVHFTARVVRELFSGCSRLQRHRLVHDAIGAAMGREIHALSLVLKAPEEDI